MNKLDLGGQVAIVTGGAAGLGLAIARRLAQSGARLAIWDIDSSALDVARKELSIATDATAARVDVTRAADIETAAAAAMQQFGRIDILVNNAGIMGAPKATWDYSEAEWRRVIDIDLIGTFLCCKAVIPTMRAAGYGRVVNIASIAGKEGNPNASAYSAAKAGVIGLTKSLGKELAMAGIAVNCVAPAAVRTAIFEQMTPEYIAFLESKIPMGRFGMPEEIAALVAWLCTRECSFSTGAVFDLSGGRATY